jgi:hypothetical protein
LGKHFVKLSGHFNWIGAPDRGLVILKTIQNGRLVVWLSQCKTIVCTIGGVAVGPAYLWLMSMLSERAFRLTDRFLHWTHVIE